MADTNEIKKVVKKINDLFERENIPTDVRIAALMALAAATFTMAQLEEAGIEAMTDELKRLQVETFNLKDIEELVQQ